MKTIFKLKTQIKGLSLFTRQGGDDHDDGGTDANPVPPDYADSDSEA